ncbi:MAG: alkaline phosphatase, partial [Chthoniobacter sp.]|nr:alkaline phosphatase [Chthoniobacter sp.]
GIRKDGRDLILEMKQGGRDIMRSKAELEDAPIFSTVPRVGIFAQNDLPFSNQIESGSQQPSLSDMVRRSIQFLQLNTKGYVLVVDAALISRAAEQNDGEHTITETLDLDHAVATALRYAGDKALILAVGRSAIGGFTLNGYPLRHDHGVGLFGTNAFGYPSITWATGPNGAQPPVAAASPPAENSSSSPASTPKEPAAFYAPSAINNAGDVIGIGIGPGSEAMSGFIDNTAIFQIIRKNL